MNRNFIGQNKIHAHVDQPSDQFSDTEKWRIGKTDHVKTLAERQVNSEPKTST
jgi:hypothetical protein